MGRKVSNLYSKRKDPAEMTLEIISNGIYDIEILFNTRFYDELAKYSWCFEQSKALVYMMDLSGELPVKMGYSTARVYLRDLLMYLDGKWNNGPTHVWNKPMEDYRIDSTNLKPLTK